jgi:site-specific recombinase XerD
MANRARVQNVGQQPPAANLGQTATQQPKSGCFSGHKGTVPLGKMKTERMVPVDSFVCQLVQRLRFWRSLDPTPANGFLLARPRGREMLLRGLRKSLHEITAAAGITAWVVPHQLRHTYATFMLRAGVSFPGTMKLLGHSSPDITMRYLGIALPDHLQREYQ